MAAAKKLPRHAEYEALLAVDPDETNHCAVIAVASATGAPYAKVKELFRAQGRKNNKGSSYLWTAAVLRELGFGMIERPAANFINRYPGAHTALRSVTTHHPDRFSKVWNDGKTYLFRCRHHILCVKGGRNLDWSRGRAKRVREIFEVIPATTPPMDWK